MYFVVYMDIALQDQSLTSYLKVTQYKMNNMIAIMIYLLLRKSH